MQSLDLIITADTSIAHLGGALGRPTWIALKHLPDWRWLTGSAKSPLVRDSDPLSPAGRGRLGERFRVDGNLARRALAGPGMTLQAEYDQAVAAHRRGEFGEAERLYRRLLEAAPSSAAARHMLGLLRAQSGDSAEALELLGAALTLKPDAPDILFNYAHVLKGIGRQDEALAAYDRALSVKPDYAAARNARAEVLNLRGNSLREAGQAAQALDFYERALADVPRYPDALQQSRRGPVEPRAL